MGTKEIIKVIENNPVAFATSSKDGKPHVIVVNFVKVKEGQLLITDNYMKKTIKNLSENDQASIVVWGSDMKGYKISGVALYLTEGEEFDIIKNIEENKDEPCKGVILFTPMDTEEI
jgi:predicted pyridoxine 5'-phosphate oxidase superfamily flavin-nucleotide-binding protein